MPRRSLRSPLRSDVLISTLVLTTLLSGCVSTATDAPADREVVPEASSGVPSPSVSTGEASPPAAAPVGTRVVIDGTGVSFADDDGSVIESVSYRDDPMAARARLTEWFAVSPTTTSTVSESYCSATTDPIVTDDFEGALTVTHLDLSGGEQGYRFSVSAAAPALGGIDIATPQGSSVGDSPEELIASIPGVSTQLDGGVTRVYYDQPDEDFTAYAWGLEGEPIQEIKAPYALEEAC